jgi:hypothetical protein
VKEFGWPVTASRRPYRRRIVKRIPFTGTSVELIAIDTVWRAAEKVTVMLPATPPWKLKCRKPGSRVAEA